MNNNKLETTIRNIVDNDIIINASYMISELASNPSYTDQLLDAFNTIDLVNSIDNVLFDMSDDEMIKIADQLYITVEQLNTSEDLNQDKLIELFNILNIDDPVYHDIFEYWIISDRFAEKLELTGGIVLRDFLNFNIWGRKETGQSLTMDFNVNEIAKSINRGL